ncbi:MAG: LamG domain-containing protein [Bacteroidales bacterium]|nr:LamG domain-containing protein [Bacteroidales bacterium]
MKSSIIILLFVPVLGFSQVLRAPYYVASYTVDNPTAEQPLEVVHYLFENNADDYSGNGNDGADTSMVYGSGSPLAQGSYYAELLSTTPKFWMNTGITLNDTFTIACWVRQSNTGGYYKIMDTYYLNDSWNGWFWWIDGVAWDLEFRGYDGGSLNIARTNDNVYSGTGWHHIAVSYRQGDGVVRLWYDGVLSMSGDSVTHSSGMDISGPYRIGRSFGGRIDDFRTYDIELTQQMIDSLYANYGYQIFMSDFD